MRTNLEAIHSLKLIIAAIVTLVAGVVLLIAAHAAENDPAWTWLRFWPLDDLGGIFVGAGVFGIGLDFLVGRDKDAADLERIRQVQQELIPEYIDAVGHAFASAPDYLGRIATPELLDDLATNALALRLGDEQFAREIYADLRDQAIRAPERWYDVDASIRLSSLNESTTEGLLRFEVLVKWEYTTTPAHPTQKFACVSDREEFRDLIAERPSTIPWLMPARPGFVANAPESFELLEYRVDGALRPIRRSTRKTGQTYTASIGEGIVRASKPVRISYLYRTIAARSNHRLFFELTQPTRGLKLELDYTDTDIARISVTDLVSTNEQTRVSQLPEELGARVLSIDLPGWHLPRAGVAYVWSLKSEVSDVSSPATTNDEASLPDVA